jgi:hypothetical protein
MVYLGDHVARPLCLDPFQVLVAFHLDPAGLVRKLDRQVELDAEGCRPAEPTAFGRAGP